MRFALLLVTIAVTSTEAQPTAARARIVENLRLDANVEDFSTIGRIYVGPRKQIVVTFPQDRQLRWYDSAGKRVGVVGRPGSGPGEFQRIGQAGWIGDTLWVFDSASRRLVFIAPDGRVLRTTPLPQNLTLATRGGAPSPMVAFGPLGVFRDGSMIGIGMIRTALAGREPVFDERVATLAPSGAATVVHVPPSLNDPRWTLDVAGFQEVVPFSVPPQVAESWDGSRFATMTTDVTTGDAGTFTVVLMRVSGDTVFARTYPFTGTRIPKPAIDSALARLLPQAEGPADLGRRFQAAAKAKMPAVYTPVQGIILGMDNTVWITMRATAEGRTTLVLNSHGDPIATVLLPPRTAIRQASIGTLWTTQADADGLTSVVRYRVTGIACGSACN